MVTLIIDGKKVRAAQGDTVLQAALGAGIKIPTLCHLADLTPEGACRLCVVEIKGVRGLTASCTYPVSEGLVVDTATPAVLAGRKQVLELLLANHPQECLTCQRNLTCELQRLAAEYGVQAIPCQGERRRRVIEGDNPFIVRDTAKCILCGRCVRVCKDIQGCNVFEWTERGFDAEVGTAFEEKLEQAGCVFCGTCVSACPTGALTAKPYHGAGLPDRKVKTTCPFCGVGCNFDLNVKNNRVTGVSANLTSAVNGRLACVKGRFGLDYIHSPHRLTAPLIRKNGLLTEATWDEALDFVARRLTEIKQKYGPDAIGALSSARCTNEENYLMQKFMRAVVGTNNIDHCART
ncbi:MAG: 2Fe-2S iron-sulfur cluster-binding protein [Negativicutes bacterium]|nr:2Fe-2S iron-sulfur cluster-binding protein [Negativicutes bacterium]